jgi:hypothetical protein
VFRTSLYCARWERRSVEIKLPACVCILTPAEGVEANVGDWTAYVARLRRITNWVVLRLAKVGGLKPHIRFKSYQKQIFSFAEPLF